MSRPAPGAAGAPASRSRAFREASLRSEERRAYGVVAVVLVLIGPAVAFGDAGELAMKLRLVGALAGVALLGIQVWSIAAARAARRGGRSVPWWLGVLGVAAECSVPTGVILAHLELGTLAPYTAVSSPPLLAYGVLIGLSTLRLRPGLCLWAGAVSAGGYVGVLAYVRFGLGLRAPAAGWPAQGYLMAGLLIFVSGVAAAWVSREIRRHVEAALDEAETRRRMERVEHDLEVASTIQRSLLPAEPPSVPGYDIAAWNRPADQTGGDYYDWQRLPDGNWIVTLADVAGHGVGPALVTAACRAYVRASTAHHGDLASLATRVNALLSEDLPDGRFVTMAGVVIQPGGGPLAVLSAGHGPIVVFAKASGRVRSISPHGLPLAVSTDLGFGPAEPLELGPGDVLVLVTDGFTEWARTDGDGRREEFGVRRLVEAIARGAALPAAGLIEAVTAEVTAFAGGVPQQDGLTMVVIRREG